MRVLVYVLSFFACIAFMLAVLYYINPALLAFHELDATVATFNPGYGSFIAGANKLIIPNVNGTDYTDPVITHYGGDPSSKVYVVNAKVWVVSADLSGKSIFIVPEGYEVGIRNMSKIIYVYNDGAYGYEVQSPWAEVVLTPGSEYWWGLMEHERPGASVVSFLITVAPWFMVITFLAVLAIFMYTRYR